MFKKIFRQQINSVTVAAALVALSSLASRALGVVRDRILAGQFGASQSLDIYYAAFRIPDLIFNLLVLGALSAGFIPIFSGLIKDMKCDSGACYSDSPNHEAWRLALNVLNLLTLFLLILSVIGMIFAPQIVRLITPGFSPEAQRQTANLTRIMFLSPIFLGISGVLGGVLQSFKRFFLFSFAPIMYNLGIIVGALYLSKPYGLAGLAIGVVIGAFLHMLIQVPTVFGLGFRYKLKFYFKDLKTRQIAKMMVPRTLSLAISQINLVVITIIASSLASGSLSVFNFANNLQSFPIGIFGISFATAAFPALALVAHDKNKLKKSFSLPFRQILFFIIPATVFLITLRAQIIRVLLGSGEFDWQATVLTMNCLAFFALSLFAQATIPLLTRVFYARHDSKTPFYLGLITVALNVVLSVLLAPSMGIAGLALAFSLANIVNFILLGVWLYSEVGDLDIKNIFWSVGKFCLAAIVGGAALQVTKLLVWPYIDMTRFTGVFIQLCASLGVGLIVYLGVCYIFKSEELFGLLASLSHRWPFKKVEIDDQGEARGV
ncbi:MAG: murein biosynthesis integral membrane protein MurJ [Candidatus Falkowbacteria bacterium]|nr:murein biosynthesis integral membrane protein MurJ [Candidatus Falkowbacteria bacterium]